MSVGKAVAKLAIPTVISQIVVILYSLADTFFVGQIGDPNQLAALSITFPIFTLLTAVANVKKLLRNGFTIKIKSEKPTMSFIQELLGEKRIITHCVLTVEFWAQKNALK